MGHRYLFAWVPDWLLEEMNEVWGTELSQRNKRLRPGVN